MSQRYYNESDLLILRRSNHIILTISNNYSLGTDNTIQYNIRLLTIADMPQLSLKIHTIRIHHFKEYNRILL